MHKLVTCSGKGGTGKTSVAANLAAAYGKMGLRVLVVDFDAQADLTACFGFSPDEELTMIPVLQREKKIEDVVQPTTVKGVDIVCGNTFLDRIEGTNELVRDPYSHERLNDSLKDLEGIYDITIIDTPPSLGWLSLSAFVAASHSLVCIQPAFFSAKAMGRIAAYHKEQRNAPEVAGVVRSRWSKRGRDNETIEEVIEEFFPGKILEPSIGQNIEVDRASYQGKPLVSIKPEDITSKEYCELAKNVMKRMEVGACV